MSVGMDRVPPHSEEAERGTLGSILLDDQKVLYHVTENRMTPEDFYIPAHRTIFEVMLAMAREGKVLDSLTVTERLQSAGVLERVGGPTTMDRLIDATPTAAHAEYYIGIVMEKARLRYVIEHSRMAERMCYEDGKSADVIAALISKVSGMAVESEPVEDSRERHKRLRNEVKAGQRSGIRSCFPGIDKLFGALRPPHHIVVAAKTSSGKTAYICNEILNFAKDGAKVSVHENDMSLYDIELRLAGILGEVNTHVFNYPGWTTAQENQLEHGWDMLRSLPIRIDDRRRTMDGVESWAIGEKLKHGMDLMIIDFLGKIKRTKEEWRHPLREVIGDWSCRTCEIGKRLSCVTCAVSQFSRSGNKEKDKTPEHPSLESLKESGDVENNADIVCLLSKKPGQPESLFTIEHPVWDIDFDVAKNRNGPIGMVDMCLYVKHQTFMQRMQGDILRDELDREKHNNV